MSLLELFCTVDDFWQVYEPLWRQKLLTSGQWQRARERELSESDMMTIVIHFHQARYRDFKTYYTQYVQVYLCREFPRLISYERFVQLQLTLIYIHMSESHRGLVGTGTVKWDEVWQGLAEAKFSGYLVLESFAAINPDLAAATCLWRPPRQSSDTIARAGLAFLWEGVEKYLAG